jgi:hypothetical protein
VYSGAAAGDDLGRSLAFLGDTDGDGYEDFAVSADDVDDGADPDHGAVYVWTGGPDGAWRGSVATTSASATLLGANASDYAGRVVADGGDLDGDGLHDVLISATGFDNGATAGVGAAYIAFGPLSGASTLASYDVRIRGSGGSDAAGYAVAGLGDTNGDGLDDLGMSGIAVDDGSTANVGSTWLYLGRSE